MRRSIPALVLMTLTATAQADWVLDNDASRLSYVTTKAAAVAEVHRFTSLAGRVDGQGNAKIDIELASVDSLIPIRDDRMREMLYEVATFPSATLTAKIDAAAVRGLAVGAVAPLAVEGMLALHGQQAPVTLDLTVAKLAGDRLLVTTRQPVIVNAAQVGLTEGIERLREVAGLPSISPMVAVTFVLEFAEQH